MNVRNSNQHSDVTQGHYGRPRSAIRWGLVMVLTCALLLASMASGAGSGVPAASAAPINGTFEIVSVTLCGVATPGPDQACPPISDGGPAPWFPLEPKAFAFCDPDCDEFSTGGTSPTVAPNGFINVVIAENNGEWKETEWVFSKGVDTSGMCEDSPDPDFSASDKNNPRTAAFTITAPDGPNVIGFYDFTIIVHPNAGCSGPAVDKLTLLGGFGVGVDADGDGFFDQAAGGTDCNDADPLINPDAPDLTVDGIDQNCDGVDGVDADGDLFFDGSLGGAGTDCNDADPLINPDAPDLTVDGIDQNCDGVDGVDADGDLFFDGSLGGAGTDCNDADPLINPDAPDLTVDGIDQNCDGVDGVDADGDLFFDGSLGGAGTDCNDADPLINPDAPDLTVDGIDQNCDGVDGVDADGDTFFAFNDPPVATDGSYTTVEDTELTGNVMIDDTGFGVDSDPDSDLVTVSGFDNPSAKGGTVNVNPDGSFTYTPATNFNGTDTFSYTISDGNGGSDTAVVSIDVTNANDPPVLTSIEVTPITATVDIGLTQQFTATGNYSDGSTADLTATIIWSATGGTIDVTGLYTAGSIAGSFAVTATDGVLDSIVIVTITVANANDPPMLTTIVVTPDSATVNVGDSQPFTAQGQDQFGSDIGSSITWSATGGTIDVNGLYTAGAIEGSFIIKATDGVLESIITITVIAANEVPVARDDFYSTGEDTTLIVATPGVLGNDDLGDEPTKMSLFDDPSANGGSVSVNPDGSFTYAPAPNFNGSDTFTYTITDFYGEFSIGTVTIDVTAGNDAPLPSSNTSAPSESDGDDDRPFTPPPPAATPPERDGAVPDPNDPTAPERDGAVPDPNDPTPPERDGAVPDKVVEPKVVEPNVVETIDTTAPETTITVSPAELSSDDMPNFEFTSTEAGSTFECQLDGGGFSPCTSPFTYSGPVADGSHTFEVRATDPAGNTDATPASYTWTIDATAPDTIITASPDDPSSDDTPNFEFTSTEAGSTFECRLDDAAFAACETPLTYSGPVPDGSHTFKVRATDSLGNTDATPASYTWTIDTTSPVPPTSVPSAIGGGGSPDDGGGSINPGLIIGLALAALALLVFLILLAKRRRRQEEA